MCPDNSICKIPNVVISCVENYMMDKNEKCIIKCSNEAYCE